jgi:hypothetical protein
MPSVVVISAKADGIFLTRFDESGAEVGDTRHRSIEDAKAQALEEYGRDLGSWAQVPEGEADPVAYGRRATPGESR